MATRTSFEQGLQGLQRDILRMGSMVEETIARAVESLARQDQQLAQQVIDGDDAIDAMDREIENNCMLLIATQQPMAKDLRRIAAAFKIVVSLERMGDYAYDIARITKRIGDEPLIKPLIDIPRMAEITQTMVKEALDAYVREDVELAKKLAKDDDMVDHLNSQVFREVLLLMMEKPGTISQGTHLLFVSRYLERIADHATNLAEEVIYLVTGDRQLLND